jgi:hypothetical protein
MLEMENRITPDCWANLHASPSWAYYTARWPTKTAFAGTKDLRRFYRSFVENVPEQSLANAPVP